MQWRLRQDRRSFYVLSTGEATPVRLEAVLGSPVQERQTYWKVSSEGTGAYLLWGKAEAELGNLEKAQGESKYLKGECIARLFSGVLRGRTRGSGHNLKHRRLPLNIWKHFLSDVMISGTDWGNPTNKNTCKTPACVDWGRDREGRLCSFQTQECCQKF